MSVEPFSLLSSPWLPVVRASGARLRIRPAELTEGLDDDPVVAVDWPRADLDAGCRELLIGLLSTACARQIVDDWEAWWHEPPAPGELDAAFAPFADAFLLDGPGPRFMQDLEPLDGERVPAGALLIDQPGANTLKKNTDLFVKRGGIEALSRAGAAIALFTLQAMAPSGGAGHRTSLRGGGPLTTLLLPGASEPEAPVPLWQQLWLNVYWDEAWPAPGVGLGDLFPWLAPTRVSEGKRITTPADVHPAQAFWGMPRRLRLDFEPNARGVVCGLTGTLDQTIVRSYRTRPWGHNYTAWSRGHPLTPYYRQKPTDPEWLPRHPQPGRLGYRDWVGLVVDEGAQEASTKARARALAEARRRLRQLGTSHPREARLHAAGYDMDNMKARGFVESEMPVRVPGRLTDEHDDLARQLVAAAREAERALSFAIRTALGDDLPADGGPRRVARDRFWDATERPFHEALRAAAEQLETVEDDDTALDALRHERRTDWLRILRRESLAIFGEIVPMDMIEERSTVRLVKARRQLTGTLLGYGKPGAGLFAALGLPAPEAPAKADKRKAA